MKSIKVYIEGGGNKKETQTRCVNAFTELLKKSGFSGRMPRTVACGGRKAAYDRFQTACRVRTENEIPILLVDSEDPVVTDRWSHVAKRDKWKKPDGVTENQLHFMATCMETWIVADRATLENMFGQCLNKNPLPAVNNNLESRDRHEIQDSLEKATAQCGRDKQYQKGKKSFQVLSELNPDELQKHLPHFNIFINTLNQILA